MSIQSTSTLSYALEEATTELVYQGMADTDLFMPSLASVRNLTGPQIQTASFGNLADWESKPEGQAAAVDRITQQFRKTFSPEPFSKIVEFTREMIDFDQWGQVEDIALMIGESGFNTIDNHLARVFNSIASTTYYSTEGGLALASAAHVNAAGALAQSNTGTEALTYAGVKATRTAFRKFHGYTNTDRLGLTGDELIYPIDLEEDAWQVVNNLTKPGGALNDGNAHKGRYTGYAWHKLTDVNAWGMMDSKARKRNLRFFDSASLEINADASFSQQVKKIGGYMRYVMGFVDWRWIYWNNPS